MVRAFSPMLLLALASCSASPEDDESAISAKMRSLAGTGATQCGILRRGGPLEQAWECATSADRGDEAFWLALEGHRVDSSVWHAVARSATGERYVVFYTSNDSGQQAFEPSFTVTPCSEPFQLFKNELFILRCGPDVP